MELAVLFTDRIRSLRELSDMSARELDALAGLQFGHTRNIENGTFVRVQAETVEKIANVFGVSLDWLWAGKGVALAKEQILAKVKRARARRESATG